MKTLAFIGLALVLSLLSLPAQTPSEIKKQQPDLERQRVELEKKANELEQKYRELEKAQQQLQAQQSSRSLSMNLSGDVLFDYDKATLKPAAEEALKKSGGRPLTISRKQSDHRRLHRLEGHDRGEPPALT